MWLFLFILCEYPGKLTGINTRSGNGLFSVRWWHISVWFLGGQWFGTGLKHFKASINISFLSNYPQGKITAWPLHNFRSYSLTPASTFIHDLDTSDSTIPQPSRCSSPPQSDQRLLCSSETKGRRRFRACACNTSRTVSATEIASRAHLDSF